MENENVKLETNEMTESISSNSESTMNKKTFEERYNKLREYAVKLKKKASELADQEKQLERDNVILNSRREEVKSKLIHISNNAKKLQTIQLEYDKLQDEMEQLKSENKKNIKNIETLVSENTSLKESLYHEKESALRFSVKLKQCTKEKTKLDSSIKHLQDQLKKLSEELRAEVVIREQKIKENEVLRNNLESEIQAHKTTCLKLDVIKQDRTSSSVLSLEVENYEKSIEDMKLKFNEEECKQTSLKQVIDEQLATISLLNKKINELSNNCLQKSNQVTSLGQKNESLKAELNEMRQEYETAQHEIEGLIMQLKQLHTDKSNLLTKIESLELTKDSLKHDFKSHKDTLENQLKDLTAEISHLNIALTNSKKEVTTLQEEFSGYKRRAQSVLRTKQNQYKEIGMGRKSVVELEEEIAQSHEQNTHLQETLNIYGHKLESLTKEVMILKEERNHALECLKETNKKQTHLRQEITSLTEQNRSQEIKIQKLRIDHKKELEDLRKTKTIEIKTTRERFEQEILDLKLELEKLKLSEYTERMKTNSSPEKTLDSNQECNLHSKVLGISLLEREECEGSESIDSCSLALANGERYRGNSLLPLDELLNSADDYNSLEVQPLPSKVSKQELEVCERSVKHLTVLLADAERDIAKLTQLNEILKEDIRRQQRSAEREQHANNFEYLKNVVFKFVTLKNGDERSHLIPVLNTILKLSPEETQKLNSVAGDRKWIPGIHIPGWNNN